MLINNKFDSDDWDEIKKSVLIAGLGALVGALITWGVEEIKEKVKERKSDGDKSD